MYTCYELTPSSHRDILNQFTPKFPDVIAHHITIEFGVPEGTPIPSRPAMVKVVGYACDDAKHVEALLVEVDGTTKRPDGKLYHITLSINRAKGAKPVQSNDIMHMAQRIEPFHVSVIGKINA